MTAYACFLATHRLFAQKLSAQIFVCPPVDVQTPIDQRTEGSKEPLDSDQKKKKKSGADVLPFHLPYSPLPIVRLYPHIDTHDGSYLCTKSA